MIEMDFGRQVLFSALLSARGEFSHSMNAGLAAALEGIAQRLEAATETQLSLTPDERRALIAAADAGWDYHNQMASGPPFTLFNHIAGLVDKDFFDLLAFLQQNTGGVPEPSRSHLLEIMRYLKEIHYTIDPLMFDVKAEDFSFAKDVLVRSLAGVSPVPSSEERYAIENLVSAAWEYSYRGKGNGLPGIQDEEFERIMKWLNEAAR